MLVIEKSKSLKALVISVLLKARKKASTLVPKKVWMTREGKNILTTVWVNPRQEEKKQTYQYGLFTEPQYGLPREKVVKPPRRKKPSEKEEPKETTLTVPISKTQFRDYGAWKIKGSVSQKQRMEVNQEIARLLNRPGDSLTKEETDTIRLYSGFGGIQAENEKGVLYDYYTSPPVAKMTYQLLNKIAPIKTGSSLLEPSCGTGVFFEVAPEGVELHGVELDKRTATAASLLQEKAKIYNSSFEEFNLHSEKQFDHVIGNAPFGERGVSTGFIDLPEEKSLDRYFISRSLDNLKPGGTMAMIVHPGVMDNKTARDWRMEMSKKGQFVGAVRLPDKSFRHTHTGVNPDIVFFRKYSEKIQQRLTQLDEAGLKQAGFFQEGWVEGTYYEQKSKHILGTKGTGAWQREIVEGTLSLQDMDNTISLFQPEPEKTEEDLQRLMRMVREPMIQPQKEITKLTPQEAGAVANKTLLVGMTKTVNGKVYILNQNHRWELLKDVAAEEVEKLNRIKKLSNLVKQIRDGMHRDEPVDELQKEARTLIEEYETDYEVSHIEDQDILRILRKNPALSQIYEGMSVTLDSALLTKQNVFDKEIEIKDGHNPAVLALLELQKRLKEADPETLRAFFPNRAEELLEEMYRNPDIYLDTEGKFHLKEDYLSGNAWEKIDVLNKAIEEQQARERPDQKNIEKWRQGVQSLKEAIGWIPIEDADIKPYSNWIPKEIVNRWVQDPDGMGYSGEVWREEETGKWETAGWAKEIIYFLNLQKQRSKHIDTETYNQQTEENWRNWLANNQEARKTLEELYNRKFNGELGIPTKTYAVDIDGWNPNVVLKPHQWQSLHHLYRQGKGISALGVGFGKTYSAIGLIALLRQEGKIKRPFLQVPNNKVKDWVEEFGKTMPGLRLGYVDPEEEGYGNRLKRYAKYQELANIDYDAIILPESAAVEIQLRPEEDEWITNEVISAQLMSKEKKTERQKEQAEERARRKLAQQEAGKNKTIDFEDLGCDAIFVDECLPYNSKVLTERGWMKIGEVVENRLRIKVVSCNLESGKVELKSVTAWMLKKLSHRVIKIILSNGGYLVCTHNHRIWTEDHGYVHAEDVAGETLRVLRVSGSKQGKPVLLTGMRFEGQNWKDESRNEKLRMVRKGFLFQIFRRKEQHEASILFRFVRCLLSVITPTCDRTKTGKGACPIRRDTGKENAGTGRENENKKSNVQSGFREQNERFSEGAINSSEGWKRTADQATTSSGRNSRIGDGIPGSHGGSQNGLSRYPEQLQGRSCDSGKEDCHRSGRKESQSKSQTSTRRKEDSGFDFVGVVRIEILERGCLERYGFRDSEDQTVYDIEVDGNHNFLAEGILVSNCHNHKNLFSSSLSRETGMNDGRRSERALSLFKKNEHMRKEHDGKNVFFLTATPLTNSPLEYYNMLMHVAPEEMQKFGIYNIDQFIREFADIQEGEKYDWSSGQVKSGRILKGFKNLQTLRDMFFKYTDLQNDPERIGLEKPKANFTPNKIDSVAEQKTIVQELSKEIERYRSMSKEEREAEYPGQNFLTFYSKMRTASLDLQLYDPAKYKDWKNPKLQRLADNVSETYKSRGGGQVIFCDRVLSGDCSFNMHEKIKKALLGKGFSEKEIVVVNGITKAGGKQAESALEKQVSKAIEGFNEGKYKVIVGTTHTLGEGVNLQKNSSALHHFDIPYRPSDFIQRNGRIDRQGNVQEQVTLHTYLTAGTIDNYSVSLVQGKANWIDQLLKTKSTVFMNPNDENFVDVDGLLLALTEEFEDIEGATRLKQEIAKRKETAVKLKKQNQAHEMLAQLALMRGALKSFVGDKGSAEYQARLRKISHLESALEKNPEFKHPELLTEAPPGFMYDTKGKRVYKIGDCLIRSSGLYRISSFDFKRNEFSFQNIDDPEDVHAWSRKSGFGWGMSDIDHLPNVKTKEDIDRYRSLFDAERFRQQDAAFKKANYRKLLQYTKKEQKLPYFYRYGAANVLKLGSTEYSLSGQKILNPFDETDRKEILDNLKGGNLELDWSANLPEAARLFEGEISKMLYEGALKAYQKHPESKRIDETISEQWQPLENFVKKIKGKMSDEYEMEQIIGKHPEYEVKYSWDIEGMKSSHRKMARKRPKVEKSILHFVIPLLETDKSIEKVDHHVLLK